MNILFIGDVFASPGRRIVGNLLHQIVTEERIDLIIANVENSAGGFGVTAAIAEEFISLGVEVMTTGNHVWDKTEIHEYLPRQPRLLRPANYSPLLAGTGLYMGKARNGAEYAVMNLQGRTFMATLDDPFRKVEELLAQIPDRIKVRFIDFHAEATSEKVAFGWHLDGRVTAVVGTHTHIPTADERVLPGGTAYQTDVGMTGSYAGVIGVEKGPIIRKFQTALPMRMEAAKGMVELHATIVTADPETGKAVRIRRYEVKE
jgi:2',3'-cyclic-nucleotide 2'-phosphodiesterase